MKNSAEAEDEDSWDFGTVKQSAPPLPKPQSTFQMHTSPSQYSVGSMNPIDSKNNYYNTPPPSNNQLPRSISKNQVTPMNRVNDLTVSLFFIWGGKERRSNFFE
jgi:hypothetical protein